MRKSYIPLGMLVTGILCAIVSFMLPIQAAGTLARAVCVNNQDCSKFGWAGVTPDDGNFQPLPGVTCILPAGQNASICANSTTQNCIYTFYIPGTCRGSYIDVNGRVQTCSYGGYAC